MINYIGTRWNKSIAKRWSTVYIPILQAEYAQVGFKYTPTSSVTDGDHTSEDILKQKKVNEYYTYATGRQNVAWTDLKLTLHKRFNPLLWVAETALAFFFESLPTPVEKMEATSYCFDGKEKALLSQPASTSTGNSGYDGFVWAVVHKDQMKMLRDDRYDLSLTVTRDHPKLPDWATTMSENSEISDALLTPELLKAIEQCGEDLEALIVTDQPIDQPKK